MHFNRFFKVIYPEHVESLSVVFSFAITKLVNFEEFICEVLAFVFENKVVRNVCTAA